jgi:hypothetical protein
MSLNENLRFVLGKSNTDPRRDQRKPPSTDERPKSHSPTTEKDGEKCPPDGNEKSKGSPGWTKPATTYGKLSPDYIKDRTSPPEKGSNWKNTSWSSADSIQHFPERDTSNQVSFYSKVLYLTKLSPLKLLFLPSPR